MPKYCSVCLGEYKESVKVCPKDDTALTTKRPAQFDRLLNCYIASDEVEAEHLIVLLDAEGIVARESVSGISQVPVASDTQFVIAVLQEDHKRAKAFIERARTDGIISTKGSFC